MWRVIASCAALSGCSSVLGIDSDRYLIDAASDAPSPRDAPHDTTLDAHTVRDAGADAYAPWACLATPPPTPPATATVVFVIGNPSAGTTAAMPTGPPVAGVVVRACRALDFECSNPLTTSAPTNDAGEATVILPGGFDGYFEVPDAAGFEPSIYWHEPVQASQSYEQTVLPPNVVALAASVVDVTLTPEAGIVVPTVLDCKSNAAAGVHFQVGGLVDGGQFFYLSDSVPSKTATATDPTGGGLLFNAPPGTITISATTPTGQLIASGTTQVRAGWLTFLELRPSQAMLQPP